MNAEQGESGRHLSAALSNFPLGGFILQRDHKAPPQFAGAACSQTFGENMKMRHIIVLFLSLHLSSTADPQLDDATRHPDLVFFEGLDRVYAEYRASKEKEIREAVRAVVYIVEPKVLDKEEQKALKFGDKWIPVAPYDAVARVIEEKELGEQDRERLLNLLAERIAEPDHLGGAFCHFPIHGVRIYGKGGGIVHEGTFCWVCGNFSFKYPMGSGWLDTTAEMEDLFSELLPIPEEVIARFKKENGEQGGAGRPATNSESDSEDDEKHQPEAEGCPR
jgi:hypothetical protein